MAKESPAQAAALLQRYGVTLAVEPVNRYETYLVNTAAQAQAVGDTVDFAPAPEADGHVGGVDVLARVLREYSSRSMRAK
jgi:hypothetical protein